MDDDIKEDCNRVRPEQHQMQAAASEPEQSAHIQSDSTSQCRVASDTTKQPQGSSELRHAAWHDAKLKAAELARKLPTTHEDFRCCRSACKGTQFGLPIRPSSEPKMASPTWPHRLCTLPTCQLKHTSLYVWWCDRVYLPEPDSASYRNHDANVN